MAGLRGRIRKGAFTTGSWITIGDCSVAEVMAHAGFDWLAVDMEHSAITLNQAQELVRTIELSGVCPLVRIGENNAAAIKRVMDTGAHGVIVPMVNCRSDAERAVGAVKYPPIGTRGVGLARAQGYGFSFPRYSGRINKESVVVVQVEHIDAVENLESILSVDGVDASIIGPYDLSGSIGCPGEFDHPAVKRAISRYERVCAKMRKPMGFHVVSPDVRLAARYRKKGYSFLAVGIDTLYLGTFARRTRDELK
jgi:2-dehydro-3-deoxyglucarate aldolase